MPLLESLRMVLSHATTQFPNEKTKVWDGESPDRQMIYFMDISRAYFNAKVDESDPVDVEPPPKSDVTLGSCALLQRHLYGTCRAAGGWQSECSGSLVEFGFTKVTSSACVFVQAERQIRVSVHGDDFTTVGAKCDLDWLETSMENKYELRKGGRLGPGKDDAKEILVLNRVIRYTSAGLEYEADPRQGKRLLEN